MNNIRNITLAAAGVVVSVVAVKSYVQIVREERAKRAEIQANGTLDIAAIHAARDVILNRINNGEIRSFAQLAETFNNEIAFAKIAIREEQ